MSSMYLTGKTLIIDDDPVVAEIVRRALLKIRYNSDSYQSSIEAIDQINFKDYDVVISDVKMPIISGFEIVRIIREKDPDIPVILMTELTDLESAISAIKEGVFDYIQKPFTADQIIFSVKRAVEKRKMSNENRYYTKLLHDKNVELLSLYENMKIRNLQLENDLQMARSLQECLYPLNFPDMKGWEFYNRVLSYEKISGDFFQMDTYDDGFSLLLADVSGHGVVASLYSAIVKSALQSMDRKEMNPKDIVTEMNRFLIKSQKKMSYSYLAAGYFRYYKKDNRLTYSICGMPFPVLIKKDGKMVEMSTNGPIIGIFDNTDYAEDSITISEGDILLLFTDGIYEYGYESDTFEAYKKFVKRLFSLKNESLKTIIDTVYDETVSKENYSQRDDITILGMKFNGG